MTYRTMIKRLEALITPGGDGRTPLSKSLDLAKEWDESKHPRQANGRFGYGGTGDLPDGHPGSNITGRSFAGERVRTGKDSLADNLVADGKGGWRLNDETQARLDARIAQATANVPVSDNPTMHMLGGGPAAGKSTATENPEYGLPNGEGHKGPVTAVLVNADLEKTGEKKDGIAPMPAYQELIDKGDPRAAGYAHEESSYFAKQIQAAAMGNGQDILLDGTGNSSQASVEKKISNAQAAGYTVNGTYVSCPTEEAMDRAVARGEKTGRVVDPDVIRSTHESVSEIVPNVASKFDSFRLIDTTGGAPWKDQVIAETTKGQPLTVHEPEAYQTFLDKSPKNR